MANEKWILIVDDEDAILSVLQKSLGILGTEYHVVTAHDGFTALEQLKKHSFDLVVTDYKMVGMNGIELLGRIRQEQPAIRVILMTAYGNLAVESQAERLDVYRYLAKPLEIDVFRQIVKEALSDATVSRPGMLILSDERYREIIQVLNQLQGDIAARCIFLTDAEGHFIARIGLLKNLPLEQIATLVGSSVATLLEAGRIIDGDIDTINLAFREGKRENLYAVNIGRQLLLIFLIDKGPYNSRIGSIWFYAQRAAKVLLGMINDVEYTSPSGVLEGDLAGAVNDQFDDLFDEPGKLSSPPSNENQNMLKTQETNVKEILDKVSPPEIKPPQNILSFEEAIGAGILNKKLSSKDNQQG